MPIAPGSIRPMLCRRADAPFDDAAYAFEPKLDGFRIIAYATPRGRVRLYTRSGRDATRSYPEVQRAIAAALDGVGAVLDGELVALDERGVPDFAALLAREGARNADIAEDLAENAPATYCAFDALAVDDAPLMAEPLETRRVSLHEIAAPLDRGFKVVDFLAGTGTRAYRASVALGFEGVIAKKLGSPYRPGERTRDWIKVKKATTADLVVGGWTAGERALAGTMGSLALGAYDSTGALRYVGNVGTGFTLAEREALHATLAPLAVTASPFTPNGPHPPAGTAWVTPRIVIEVEFLEVTKDGKLRAATFRSLRTDKPVNECRLDTELAGVNRHPAAAEG